MNCMNNLWLFQLFVMSGVLAAFLLEMANKILSQTMSQANSLASISSSNNNSICKSSMEESVDMSTVFIKNMCTIKVSYFIVIAWTICGWFTYLFSLEFLQHFCQKWQTIFSHRWCRRQTHWLPSPAATTTASAKAQQRSLLTFLLSKSRINVQWKWPVLLQWDGQADAFTK